MTAKSREERREEARQYQGDVEYAIWLSGGSVDRVDYNRVQDHYYDGFRVEEAARHELNQQRPKPEEERDETDD